MLDKTKTNADLLAQIEALKAENAKLKQSKQGRLTMKISPKGCLSVYGMGRWPISLYKSQWQRLLGMTSEIEKFMADNADKLAEKA